MRVALLVLAFTAGLGSTAVATAQSVTPTPPPRVTGTDRIQNFDRARADRGRRDHERANSAERRERAARLSAMANGGQCDEAIAAATDEHDPDMAAALRAACAAPSN